MFTKNLRVFGQILHLQWLAQTSKMGQKNGLCPLGMKECTRYGCKCTKRCL
jgi:hypothetical protein